MAGFATDRDGAGAVLPAALERAVLHWGELGSRWGVSRSVAQIHGLLYLAGRPLPADEIATALGIARSNVSTGLRDLVGWRLVHKVPRRGDRREYFEAEADLWSALAAVIRHRKAREFDPLLALLGQAAPVLRDDPAVDPASAERARQAQAFLEMLNAWFGELAALPRPTLIQLVRLGGKVAKAAGKAKKDKGKDRG